MTRLNQYSINDVLATDITTQAQVLYKYLAEGTPHEQIESSVPELTEHLGWNSWQIVKFYGFGKKDKAQYSHFTFEEIKAQLEHLDTRKIADYHLENIIKEEEGKDLFEKIKTKVAQLQIRKEFLSNQ